DQRECNGLRYLRDLYSKRIICAPASTAGISVNDLNLTGSLLTLDKVFGPADRANGRIDQFSACFSFVVVESGGSHHVFAVEVVVFRSACSDVPRPTSLSYFTRQRQTGRCKRHVSRLSFRAAPFKSFIEPG